MTATVGARVSLQEGSLLRTELVGGALNAKRVERCAEFLEAEVATDEKQNVELMESTPPPPTL